MLRATGSGTIQYIYATSSRRDHSIHCTAAPERGGCRRAGPGRQARLIFHRSDQSHDPINALAKPQHAQPAPLRKCQTAQTLGLRPAAAGWCSAVTASAVGRSTQHVPHDRVLSLWVSECVSECARQACMPSEVCVCDKRQMHHTRPECPPRATRPHSSAVGLARTKLARASVSRCRFAGTACLHTEEPLIGEI